MSETDIDALRAENARLRYRLEAAQKAHRERMELQDLQLENAELKSDLAVLEPQRR